MNNLNIFLALMVVIFTIFILAQSETKACPPGYQYDSTTFTVNGCTIEVTFCYYCSATGVGFDMIKQVYKIPYSCWTYASSHQQEVDDAADVAILEFLMNINGCIKPCSDPGWQLHVAQISELPCCQFKLDNQNQVVWILPCEGTGYCYKFYTVCVEIINGQPQLTYLPDHATSNLGDCQLLEPPEIPENAPDGWTSECFTWGYCGF
ncbi:MAG: hypothetical protein A2X64_03920 [Ignavibacteria bacterium GWF2_33_9]|nr:MAG: hypothetical protein A2X64_03920 [Ignavibacteria bacterium GWF2_33_9]